MRKPQTYSINEAAALTGLHRNTVRQRIRLGQLEATIEQGKFGEEYRITHEALIRARMLPETGPLGDSDEDVLEAHVTEDGAGHGRPDERPSDNGALAQTTVAALAELYQRHEQAMFRLGYLQGELDRVKALAETAESLRRDNEVQGQELQSVRVTLEEKERQAREAEALRRELEQANERLREMEALRRSLDNLKELAAEQERQIQALDQKRPWWQFWKG
jgi:excisionase family DNA binding protein